MAIDALMDLYSQLLSEVGPERFVAAYTLVLNTSKFRPDISELRSAAGARCCIPDEREAKDSLGKLITLMRHHGRKLTNRGKPEKDPPQDLPELMKAALRDMGYGSILAGFESLWAHPALDEERKKHYPDEMDRIEGFRATAGEKIERKWVEFYVRRKAEGMKAVAA